MCRRDGCIYKKCNFRAHILSARTYYVYMGILTWCKHLSFVNGKSSLFHLNFLCVNKEKDNYREDIEYLRTEGIVRTLVLIKFLIRRASFFLRVLSVSVVMLMIASAPCDSCFTLRSSPGGRRNVPGERWPTRLQLLTDRWHSLQDVSSVRGVEGGKSRPP